MGLPAGRSARCELMDPVRVIGRIPPWFRDPVLPGLPLRSGWSDRASGERSRALSLESIKFTGHGSPCQAPEAYGTDVAKTLGDGTTPLGYHAPVNKLADRDLDRSRALPTRF
jgi:hypothetical protein